LSIYINYKLFINFFTQTGADFYNKLTISHAQYIRRFRRRKDGVVVLWTGANQYV
jgi:hypothetical protein